MLNEGNFRDNLIALINNPDNYTKKQIYDAFLEVTERYLDELASTLNFERDILARLGEEKGNEEIERIAMSNPALNDLGRMDVTEEDKRQVIMDLLAFTECEFGYNVGGDEDEEDIDLDDEDLGGE